MEKTIYGDHKANVFATDSTINGFKSYLHVLAVMI